MSGAQTKNAALTTALAFHYQVLIGLDKCFSIIEGQSVWFEKDGDISLVDSNFESASQTEVKSYTSPLTDHHENLWNTLKNWLDPKFKHENYGALILHTTQAFGATTRLKIWNTQTAEQRKKVLKDIYSERTEDQLNAEKPSKIIQIQKTVMNTNNEILLNVLEKVTLFTEADDANALENSILDKPLGIPKSNRKSYLEGLVGFVYGQADKKSWEIQYTDFVEKCEELTTLYCKREFTFPVFTGHEASEQEVEKNQEKLFVRKINDIDHSSVISDAIGNWLELQNSLSEELDGHPQYAEKTKKYQNQLVKRLKLKYSSAKDELPEQPDQTIQIKKSRKLYNETITEIPLNIGSDTPPIEYKNGLIHDAMDDDEQDLKWKVEQ